MIRCGFICILFMVYGVEAQVASVGPPKPPLGKRWVLNPDFSDEFNGTELDTTKWLNYHPTWIGRPPGLFMPSQVSVKDGFLQIKGEKMKQDTIVHAYGKDIVFNIKGGAVVSKKAAFLGYYECRVKAAATSMSTTFWFSGNNVTGPKGCDQYSQEWDIQECIGKQGDFKGSYFASGMHSNAHYWYNDCEGERHDYRASQVRFENEEVASKDFHVYGGWWRDALHASYYYDNRAPKHQKFFDSISSKPMNTPMYMRLVCETYPFPWISLPTDEELADDTKNTVYYDWVRGYELVDVHESTTLKPEALIKIYDEGVYFEQSVLQVKSTNKLKIPLTYKANVDRTVTLKLLNEEGKMVAQKKFTAHAGYANMEFDFELLQVPKRSSNYKLVSHMCIKEQKDQILDINTIIINLKN
ncbi:glycosyl hydrolase family protein [Tamlana fucoidanivorans]|uniref:Glycosyl hydrolase family protein n=2 Tax=Allotamlana fucoidanivorans TaxID=2583814 RepID=A0A5C4SHX1_9FLAO|nr:glycosyl hydrolase family protein [Tamlana fucoidanivorans]